MKELEHKDYTPFEYACQLGNISSLKLILSHQSPQENNPIYLNGLLQSIANNQLEVTELLLEHPGYQKIINKNQKEIFKYIQEYGHYHLLEQLDERVTHANPAHQMPLPIEELQQSIPLDMPEQIVLQALSTYYQSSISQKSVTQHLQDIQEQLAKRYQQHPVIFSYDGHQQISLPLTWEGFLLMRSTYPESIQEQMLKAYEAHPIHCAWRFFLAHDHFSSQQRGLNANYSDMSWMIILMWTVAHDPNLVNAQETFSLEERISLFINELANLRHIEPDYQVLQKFLIHAVLGHPLTKILDSIQLHEEHRAYLKSYWLQQLNTLNIDSLLQIHLDWCHFILHPHIDMPASLTLFKLYENETQIFKEQMSKKWGSRWSDNLRLFQESTNILQSSRVFLLFQEVFQYALDIALEQARSTQVHQFNFFYHDEFAAQNTPLDHHHKIN